MHHRRPFFLHPLQYLLFILVLLLLPPSWSGAGATTYDGEFTFNGFSGDDLTMDGDASITNDSMLSLTDLFGPGHAFYPNPLDFISVVSANSSSVPSFSTTFVFAIVGHYLGSSNDAFGFYSNDYGNSNHGLAFVLSSTKVLDDFYYGQYMGLNPLKSSSSRFFAVELDTKWDEELADIDDNHIGIDNNSIISISSASAGYYDSEDGKFYGLNLTSTKPMQVWVDYDSKQTILSVTVAPYSSSTSTTKPSRPLLSVAHDLSTSLEPKAVYAGFSSATDTANKHYILGWSFKVNGEAAALDYSALSLMTIIKEPPTQQVRPHSYKTLICKVLLPIVAVAILVSAALFSVYMKRGLQARRTELEWQREYGPPSFAYKELLAATSRFNDKMLLGRGGFGSVYRGVLPVPKQMVAIKRVSPESRQGMNEFISEIIILGHLRHRNLVQLLGHCRHKQQLLLVYDFMPNGSLDSYLHTPHRNNTNLCWAQRFHIIKGVASGLFYLHEDWEQVVIHRDIKTSNVLLDDEMNARLGDFGLARSHDHGADAHTTHLAGTYGYIAPELARLGKATKATDVFAFGVLMLEVACARRPIWGNTVNGDPLTLADWVLTTWRARSITDTVDPRLDDYVEEEIELVLKLGLLCSHPSPNSRPQMRLVMQYLEGNASLPADLQPDTLLSSDQGQDEMHDQHAMSCPATVITDLSKGR